MAKFKVGDRVKTNGWGDRTRMEVPDGTAGTVVRTHESLPYQFSVALDIKSWTNGLPLLCHPNEIEPFDGKEEGDE